jgi:hypothetical protein
MSEAAMGRPPEPPEHPEDHAETGAVPRCPSCGWQNVRFAKSHAIDHALALLNIRPFRCRSCRHRFYRLYRRPAA